MSFGIALMGRLPLAMLAAALVAVGLAYATGWRQGQAAEAARATAARLVEVEAGRIRERALAGEVERVAGDALRRERAVTAVADSAVADLRRLQRAIFAYGGAGSVAAPGADGETPNGRLGDCAARLVTMAGRADRYAAQLIGLQDYVGRVCVGVP